MPDKEPTPGELPSDETLLAALERAERHQTHDRPGVLLATLVEHIGLRHSPWTTRRLRPSLEALEAGGQIERIRRQGLKLWGLTPRGRRRLASKRRAGTVSELPEAPQHLRWREAQMTATNRFEEFRNEVRVCAAQAVALLEDRHASSTAWEQQGTDLRRACDRVAWAIYCLNEWAEPDDAHADIEEPGRVGRRRLPAGR